MLIERVRARALPEDTAEEHHEHRWREVRKERLQVPAQSRNRLASTLKPEKLRGFVCRNDVRDTVDTARRQGASLLALRIAESLGEVQLDARRPPAAMTLLRAERATMPTGGRSLPVWRRTEALLETARTAAFDEVR